MSLLQIKGYKNHPRKEKQKILKKYLTNPLISVIIFRHDGRLAQLGEHLPYKQRVTGSSPVLSTIGFFLKEIKISLSRMAW